MTTALASRNRAAALVFAAALMATVVVANLLVVYLAPIPLGFGLLAPAGVLVAGLAFTFRDLLDDAGGRRWVLASIVGGAALSLALGLALGQGDRVMVVAFAGALAYAVSETIDWIIYRALRSRSRLGAVAASGAVALVVDSVIFLAVAFGSQAFLPGQILGKVYALAAALVVLAVVRRVRGR